MSNARAVPAEPYAGVMMLIKVDAELSPMGATRPAYRYNASPTDITTLGVPAAFLCGQKGCSGYKFVDLETGEERPLWRELAAHATSTYAVIHTTNPAMHLDNIAKLFRRRASSSLIQPGILSEDGISPVEVVAYEFFSAQYAFDMTELEELLSEIERMAQNGRIDVPQRNISAAWELIELHDHVNPTLLSYLTGAPKTGLIDFEEVPLEVPEGLRKGRKASSFVESGHRRVFVAKALDTTFPEPVQLGEVSEFAVYL